MKVPGISKNSRKVLYLICHALRNFFKVITPIGAVVLVFGTATNTHVSHRSRIPAAAEFLLGLSCLALALDALLEGILYVLGFSRSIGYAVVGILPYMLAATVLGGAGVGLWLEAVRHWST
jgi:hypothetical protein